MQKVIERWSDFSSESKFSDVECEDSSSDSSEDEIEEQSTKMYFGRILYNYIHFRVKMIPSILHSGTLTTPQKGKSIWIIMAPYVNMLIMRGRIAFRQRRKTC